MGIYANIYECSHGRDRLSVIPAGVKRVCIVNADGPFDPSPEAPAAMIVKANGGDGIAPCVPVIPDVDRQPWLMKGYGFVASCDSRFRECVEAVIGAPFYGAVALHDRCER